MGPCLAQNRRSVLLVEQFLRPSQGEVDSAIAGLTGTEKGEWQYYSCNAFHSAMPF